jgi:exonuclease VII small subunit
MSGHINEARAELEAAQSALETALRAWDESVSELWRTSLTLTQAQKRVTRAHELLRTALDVSGASEQELRRY